jgi:hypothetical protein
MGTTMAAALQLEINEMLTEIDERPDRDWSGVNDTKPQDPSKRETDTTKLRNVRGDKHF